MKFLHLSDLHLGRKFYQISLLDIQEKILKATLDYIDENQVEGIFLAGDIYDKGVPVADAVTVLDNFLTQLAKRHVKVFLISGNHDSPERLQFGSTLFQSNNIHIASHFHGTLEHVAIKDAYGQLNIYMLPFVKLAQIACCYPEEHFHTLQDAIAFVINQAQINRNERNILLYHGFVLHGQENPETSDSELQLGGVQLLDASIFSAFDYVALGHIHKPQWVVKNRIRYSGSLMKYSFSESRQMKSMTLVESVDENHFSIQAVPLPVEREMRIIQGKLEDLLEAASPSEDFVRAELTDAEIVPYANEKLRVYYPNLMEMLYVRQKEELQKAGVEALHTFYEQSLLELLTEFCQDVYQMDIRSQSEDYAILQKLCQEMEDNS